MENQKGTCPVCNGTKRMPAGDNPHKKVWYGYDPETDTLSCSNCGGQTVGRPTGLVKLRPDGTPCKHSYVSKQIGRCYNRYTCTHCGDVFDIDSSG